MNLAIITTLGINAGDNFIYEGFKRIFPRAWLDSTFLISKASIPRSKAYREWVDAADLVVICGSPIFYEDCYKMHWQRKLLDYCERRRKPILVFAVGSNFPCSLDGSVPMLELSHRCDYADFIGRLQALAWRPLSVRDAHALAFLDQLNLSNIAPLPCPSLFARPVREATDGEWLAFIWGETHWRAPLSPDQVFQHCRAIQGQLEQHFTDKRVVWICHDEESYRRLCQRMGHAGVIYSNNYPDYFYHYERCAAAVSVKVHGTMLLASMGIPSVLLQLDSRAGTLHAIGEPGMPLQATPEEVARHCLDMWEARHDFRQQIATAKAAALPQYAQYFGEAVSADPT